MKNQRNMNNYRFCDNSSENGCVWSDPIKGILLQERIKIKKRLDIVPKLYYIESGLKSSRMVNRG